MRLAKGWGVSFVVGALSILPAFTNIKLGSLQAEDFVLLALLAFCVSKWILQGFQFVIPSALAVPLKWYVLLLMLILSFSLAAFRLTFYPLDNASVLKTPILYSASRFLQFAAVISGFFWISSALMRDRRRLDLAIKLYWRTGLASCVYAVVSYVALREAHVDLFGAYGDESLRARGFFIEGGPFGLYIVSVIMVGLLRRHLTGKRIGYVNALILGTAFLLSQSKAGLFAIALLFFVSVVSAASFRKKVAYLSLAAVVLGGFAAAIHIDKLIESYIESYQDIEYKVAFFGADTNVVMGRIAGSYIVPRMIEAHPITGIGIGNYPLMRNDPRYLGPLPSIRYQEDEPGLGILGYASELGIPATALFLILIVVPYVICRKSASIIALTALFQATSQMLGVQPTFFYPWFVSACALAAREYRIATKQEESPVRAMLRLAAQNSAS